MRGVIGPLLAAILIATAVLPPGQAEVAPEEADCGPHALDHFVADFIYTSGGAQVHACVVYPMSAPTSNDFPSDEDEPLTLIVVAHGFGHTVQASWVPHMIRIAEAHDNVALVATNYRDNFGFPIMQGAEDLVRSTEIVQDSFLGPFEETILFSVSMGSAIGGTAIHIAADQNDGEGIFDHWIDLEGATSPHETWAAAKAVSPLIALGKTASDGMERDAGGTPAEEPEAWAARIPLLHVNAIADAGIRSARVVHGLNDGLVPYDQGRQMAHALSAAGIPTSMHTIVRGADDHTSGTTPTSHAGQPDLDPNEQQLHLAGHGSEADAEHIVMKTGFELLAQHLAGALPPSGTAGGYSEHIIDQDDSERIV